MNIVSNYIDLGFGSNTIDYSIAPFNNISDTEYSSEGFGGSEFLTINNNTYENKKTLAFSSKEIKLDKNLVKYEYNDVYERGRVRIEANSFKIVKLLNKNIIDPIFVCTPNKSNVISDVSISVEKINSYNFKIFNPCNEIITADYIATFTTVKKTKMLHDQNKLNQLNKTPKTFLYS